MLINGDSGGGLPGSIIKFGAYDWRILGTQNSKALLLSDKIIEVRAYHSASVDITWAECELRGYLNGMFFDSFSTSDKSRIAETTIVTKNNPWYGTYGGSPTKDRLFLLSIEEAVKYFGDSGRLEDGPPEDDDFLGCIDDEYNFMRIACGEGGDDSWWLRSPGKYGSCAALVTDDGEISVHGPFADEVFAFGAGVRPALWLKL